MGVVARVVENPSRALGEQALPERRIPTDSPCAAFRFFRIAHRVDPHPDCLLAMPPLQGRFKAAAGEAR